MNIPFAIGAVALLLGSALIAPASAQRPARHGERVEPGGRAVVGIGSARGETGRAGTDPRGVARDPRTVGRPPADQGRDSRWGGHYPTGRHPYGAYHGGRFRHHGLHVGAHFGSAFIILAVPVVYPTYVYAAPYSIRYSASGASTVMQGDLGGAAAALAVDHLSGGVVRLTWRPDGRAVEEVGLFLADAQQRVLAVQTLRAPPFSALFEPGYQAAYVGITIVYADGQTATTLLPYVRR
jgi:hypothetical protein